MEIPILLVGINGRYKKKLKAHSFVNQNSLPNVMYASCVSMADRAICEQVLKKASIF